MKLRIELSGMQGSALEQWMRGTKSRIEAQRCRIISLLAQGESRSHVQEKVGCVRSTVSMTLYRFWDEGIKGLLDKRLQRGPRKATAPVRAQLLEYLDGTPRD